MQFKKRKRTKIPAKALKEECWMVSKELVYRCSKILIFETIVSFHGRGKVPSSRMKPRMQLGSKNNQESCSITLYDLHLDFAAAFTADNGLY